MERKAKSGILFVLLISNVLTLALKTSPAKAGPNEITVTGKFVVKHPTWAQAKPIGLAYFELRDRDKGKPYDVLAVGSTAADGSFSIGPVSNIDDEEETQDIFIELLADTFPGITGTTGAKVVDANLGPWWNTSLTVENVPDGTYDFGTMTVDEPENGAFNIYSVLMDGYYYVRNHPPFEGPPKVTAVWYPGKSDGTYYDNVTRVIHANGAASDPDQWDDGVLLHEYGHHIADVYGFNNNPSIAHVWAGLYSQELAWSEGWAHYFSCLVRQSLSYRDTSNDANGDGIGEAWLDFNVENGVCTGSDGSSVNANNNGFRCEASVAGILWDICDNVDDDQNGDGIGDTLTASDNLVWDVVRNYRIGGRGIWTVFELSKGWIARGHDLDSKMAYVFWEHVPPLPQDINCDGIVDILDLIFLAGAYGTMPGAQGWNFLYDLYCDGIIDIYDLIKLAKVFGMTFP